MQFRGTVKSRSSRRSGGPPGETEIQRLNPTRKIRIIGATGWPKLAEGTLNLRVENHVVLALASYPVLVEEPADEIAYPHPYERIPKLRGGYWYYRGLVLYNGLQQEVLVRRAQKAPLRELVELLAPVNLRSELGLNDDDMIDVEVV